MNVAAGVFGETFPYLRIGSGRPPLVVLPGMVLDNRPPGSLVARSYGHGFRRLAEAYTLYVVQRRRRLPGPDNGRIAADYVPLLSQLDRFG